MQVISTRKNREDAGKKTCLKKPTYEVLEAGAQDFIQKPFSVTEISEKLKKVLEGK